LRACISGRPGIAFRGPQKLSNNLTVSVLEQILCINLQFNAAAESSRPGVPPRGTPFIDDPERSLGGLRQNRHSALLPFPFQTGGVAGDSTCGTGAGAGGRGLGRGACVGGTWALAAGARAADRDPTYRPGPNDNNAASGSAPSPLEDDAAPRFIGTCVPTCPGDPPDQDKLARTPPPERTQCASSSRDRRRFGL
jgi:hypothetical protein